MVDFKKLCDEVNGIIREDLYWVGCGDILCEIPDEKNSIEKLKMIDSQLSDKNLSKEMENMGVYIVDYTNGKYGILLEDNQKKYYGIVEREISPDEQQKLEKHLMRTPDFKNSDSEEMEIWERIKLECEITEKIKNKFNDLNVFCIACGHPPYMGFSCEIVSSSKNIHSFDDFIKKVNKVQEYLNNNEIIDLIGKVE